MQHPESASTRNLNRQSETWYHWWPFTALMASAFSLVFGLFTHNPFDYEIWAGWRVATIMSLSLNVAVAVNYAQLRRYFRAALLAIITGLWLWFSAGEISFGAPELEFYLFVPILIGILYCVPMLLTFIDAAIGSTKNPSHNLFASPLTDPWVLLGLGVVIAGALWMILVRGNTIN